METTFQKRNIFLMLFFTIITFGIYVPIWFYKQQDLLNNLGSEKRINLKLLYFLLIIAIIGAIPLAARTIFILSDLLLNITGAKIFSVIITTIDLISFLQIRVIDRIMGLLFSVPTLILSFRVQDILNHYFNKKLNRDIAFSGLLTFFCTIYYLQYKLNYFNNNPRGTSQDNS